MKPKTLKTSLHAVDCQNTVDTLYALTDKLNLPEANVLFGTDDTHRESRFNVNSYFAILTHLSMESGFCLDYMWKYYPRYSGYPFLYARKNNEPILKPNYPALPFDKKKGKYAFPESDFHWQFDHPAYLPISRDFDVRKLSYAYIFENNIRMYTMAFLAEEADDLWQYKWLDHVKTDKTASGFFELALLRIMGQRFYFYWHAGYNDFRPICSLEGLRKYFEVDHGKNLPAEIQTNALLLDPVPTIQTIGDKTTVSIFGFTSWGGFQRKTFTISNNFPHTMEDVKTETFISYDCNIVF